MAGMMQSAIIEAMRRLDVLLSVIGRVRSIVELPSLGNIQSPPKLNSLGGGAPVLILMIMARIRGAAISQRLL